MQLAYIQTIQLCWLCTIRSYGTTKALRSGALQITKFLGDFEIPKKSFNYIRLQAKSQNTKNDWSLGKKPWHMA